MPYFFILPGFVVYLAGMGIALLVTVLHRPAAWLRPYLASVLLWSSIGFVVSTAVYLLALVASVQLMDRILGGKPSTLGGIAMGMMVFVAPFVAAAGGLFGGAAIGVRRHWASIRRAA
jgi:uncharacterized membrane protein YjfL (UPF0719 family)